MRTILCLGDSNTWGCTPLTRREPPRRYEPWQRWPGVLRRELGDGYRIVEEGLNGRTTVWDDGLEPHRNGKDLLLPSLSLLSRDHHGAAGPHTWQPVWRGARERAEGSRGGRPQGLRATPP